MASRSRCESFDVRCVCLAVHHLSAVNVKCERMDDAAACITTRKEHTNDRTSVCVHYACVCRFHWNAFRGLDVCVSGVVAFAPHVVIKWIR